MNKLRSSETKLFKVLINNERIKLINNEYSFHHIYLHGFRKANIDITQERINGEIDYETTPELDVDNDTLTLRYSEEPVIKHEFFEKINNTVVNNILTGLFEPLYARISDENNFAVTINNKYVFNTTEIALLVKGFQSIINILIYPFRLVWIYSPKAYVEIDNTSNKLIFKINETSDNYLQDEDKVENGEHMERREDSSTTLIKTQKLQ